MKKVWYKSKIIRLNVVVAALVVLEAKAEILQPYLSVDFYTLVAIGLPVLNAMLRVITNTGISVKEEYDDTNI